MAEKYILFIQLNFDFRNLRNQFDIQNVYKLLQKKKKKSVSYLLQIKEQMSKFD